MKKIIAAIKPGFILGCCITASALCAQRDESLPVIMNEFRQLQQAYLHSTPLSFAVRYRYAAESDPAVILDSVLGKVQLSKGRSRYVLDSTEAISNDRYAITLFREDKVMYLSRSSGRNTNADPLMMLDSAFSHIPGLQCAVQADKSFRTLSFVFPPHLQYKKIDFVIDTVSGLLVKAVYTVKAQDIKTGTASGAGLHDEEYARIEADFYDYSREEPDNALFDEKEYFRKEGKALKATEKYKQYKIITGSPNL